MALSDSVRIGGVEVRPHEHAVLVDGVPIDLTSREYEIVERLAEHPGWVFSAEQLSADTEEDYSPESVSVLMSRLRRKLESAGATDVVETVRGLGYRFRLRPEDREAAGLGGPDRTLRDAAWHLQEAVVEVEHTGSDEQRRAAVEALEAARRAIYNSLAD